MYMYTETEVKSNVPGLQGSKCGIEQVEAEVVFPSSCLSD